MRVVLVGHAGGVADVVDVWFRVHVFESATQTGEGSAENIIVE
jgi:hypothetical protein